MMGLGKGWQAVTTYNLHAAHETDGIFLPLTGTTAMQENPLNKSSAPSLSTNYDTECEGKLVAAQIH